MLNLRTRLLLAGALLGASLAPLGSSSIAVAIPLIATGVGSDIATVTRLLVGGYLFISIVGQVPGGRLADRFGSMPVLYAGLIIYIAGCLLGYLIENLATLTISRMAMALGTALIAPATAALIRIQIPVPRLAFAFGIYGSTMSAAASLGPWVGGLVVSQQHWSWIFAINLPVALISATLIYFSIDRQNEPVPAAEKSRSLLDWQGLLLLAIAVLCLQAGLGFPSVLLLLGAALSFYLFYRNERSHPSPIVHASLFRNGTFLRCCAITALNNFTMYGVMFHIPILLTALGVTDPLRAGTVLLAMTAWMMICGPASGNIAANFGNRNTLVFAQLIGAAGLFSLILTLPVYGEDAVAYCIALLGISVGLVMPLVQTTALAAVPISLAGAAAGAAGTARYIGGALGIACMSALLATGEDLRTHLQVLYLFSGTMMLMLLFVLSLPQKVKAFE